MKLTLGVAAALAGCAAAAQPAADVYVLPASGSPSTPSLPRSLARLILLQRLAPIGSGPSIHDIPASTDSEKVVSLMNQFGKAVPPLFLDGQPDEPSQLVIMLEGMTEKQIEDTRRALEIQPAFTVSDPPSAGAHNKLIKHDFYNAGVTNEHKCPLDEVTNPFEEQCWSGKSTVAKYNVQKKPEILADFVGKFPRLTSLAEAGEMQTTVLLLPSVSESSDSKHWSDKPQEVRRRQAERVITSFDKTVSPVAPTSSASGANIFHAPSGPIPACFKSLDSCISATGNCSHQGECLDKFASADASSEGVCFACHCMSTRAKKDGPLTHWAGPVCAKKDVSVPFWLFAGFTLLLVGILSFATSMLYSVGEERLPGVIGAGVSKSK